MKTRLDPRFDVGGAYFIPAGSVDESDLHGASAVILRPAAPRTTH